MSKRSAMRKRRERLSASWPPPFPKNHPTSLDWRVTRLEEHVDEILERPSLPDVGGWPWMRIIGVLLLLGLGARGHLSWEQVAQLVGRMFGLSSPGG
jgi:hypothetical protein